VEDQDVVDYPVDLQVVVVDPLWHHVSVVMITWLRVFCTAGTMTVVTGYYPVRENFVVILDVSMTMAINNVVALDVVNCPGEELIVVEETSKQLI